MTKQEFMAKHDFNDLDFRNLQRYEQVRARGGNLKGGFTPLFINGGYKMKELTKEQLAQEMKELKQKMQLNFVNDLLDRMEHLAEKTMKNDYEPSDEEALKMQKIKRYADVAFENIKRIIQKKGE